MKKITFLYLLLSALVSTHAQTYYVAPGGSNTLSTNINAPGDIQFAFSNAPSGTTVHIKSGYYGNINLTVGNHNTTFLGYTNSPGDLTESSLPSHSNNYSLQALAAVYPTIDRQDRITGSWVITCHKDNVTLKGIHVANGGGGITVAGDSCTISNAIAANFGNVHVFYHGWGINTYGHYNTIENSIIYNAAAEGCTVKGDYNHVNNLSVYADDTTGHASTDYYVLVTPNSSTSRATGNVVENSYIERVGNIPHSGHGFCITTFYIHKTCPNSTGYCYDSKFRDDLAYNNVIKNCTSKNIGEPVLLRGAGVQNNDMHNITSLSYGGLTLTSGCKNNTFTNCKIYDTYYYKSPTSSSIGFNAAVEFFASGYGDTTDQNVAYSAQGTYPWEQSVSAQGNAFINCLFQNVSAGINISSYSEFEDGNGNLMNRETRKIARNNDFINCTFIGRSDTNDCLFYAMRGNADNRMINCIVYGFQKFESRYFPTSQSQSVLARHSIIPSNFEYINCNFYNNQFNQHMVSNGTIAPTSGPIVTGFKYKVGGSFVNCNFDNPEFINPSTGNYALSNLNGNGTVDKGISQNLALSMGINIPYDLDSNVRVCNNIMDIGAYEYDNCTSTSIMDQIDQNELDFYPNPNHGIITIENSSTASQSFEIYGLSGQLIHNSEIGAMQQLTIDLTAFKDGIYFLRTSDGISRKLIKITP